MEPFGCEIPAEWFGTQFAEHLFRIGREPYPSELASIVEHEIAQTVIAEIALSRGRPGKQFQDQAIVFFGLAFTLFDHEGAAHAQMDQQAMFRKLQNKELCPACN